MRTTAIVALALTAAAAAARSQNPPAAPAAPAPAANPPLDIGAPAPDFALAGATRYGTVREPIRLSDYRGKAVVLAFFFRARTRG
jgi:hypothetical protein